ncbi:MAG: O-methyltransferase [Bacteroidia bacterium]|nr:O-methyltransferase [Bacteroidia bacterium]
MIGLVSKEADVYASKMSLIEDELLQVVNVQTLQTHKHAHMLCGNLVGTFLTLISRSLNANRILEIGTFTGYSALCLAKGLKAGGILHTIELREEDAATAKTYFDQSIYKNNIILHVGDAKQIIPELKEEWDIVFIDADKTGYIDYYELVLPSVKQNGFIIADNVLFHGQVLEQTISGKSAKAIDAFNAHVKNDSRVAQVLLTVRDGLLLIQKL